MNRRQAKKEAYHLIAADLQAQLSTASWEDQGLLDEYSQAGAERILSGADEILDELWKRGR